MSQAIPISEKAMALTSNIFMNSTTRFIRSGSISPTPNQPQSQSFIPSSQSLEKGTQQSKKGIISRKMGSKRQEPAIQQERANKGHPQNPVRSNSKSKIESVQEIAMNMSASIFMNSTTKFVKGLLLNQQSKTQRFVSDIKKQNQKQKISPATRDNVRNPQQASQKPKNQKKINQTAKKSQVQSIPLDVMPNKKYSPPKTNQNNSVPLKSANIPLKNQIKKEQVQETQKKSIDRKQVPKRQVSPPNQKPSKQNIQPVKDRQARTPENNAHKMAGEQFLNSTTKFVKNVGLPPAAESILKIEPKKGKSSPPAVQRLQTQLSFTPIKSTIGLYSNTDLSMPINSPKRNRLQTDTTNKVVHQENAEQNTRKIQRKGSKTRDIKFVQKKQQEPVSILNYHNNKPENQKAPNTAKNGQITQTKKQGDVSSPKKNIGPVQKKQVPKQIIPDNHKYTNRPANRYIANFSNNQSRIQENNETEFAKTKKGPFVRQTENKEAPPKKQQVLDKTASRNDIKSPRNVEQIKQQVIKKEEKNISSINSANKQYPKSPRVGQNPISNATYGRQAQAKNNPRKDQASTKILKLEEQTPVETRKYVTRKPNQQLTTLNTAKPKESKPDMNQSKLNASKSVEVVQNLWSRPSQQKKIVTQTKIPINSFPQDNKGLNKEKEAQIIKSSPNIYSNKNIRQINSQANISKTQKTINSPQTGTKVLQNINKNDTRKNVSEVATKIQKQRIQTKNQKQIAQKDANYDSQKYNQPNDLKLKRSALIFHSVLKLYATHMKIHFDQLRRKSATEARHKKQANILIYATSNLIDKLRINHLSQVFSSLKKNLLTNTPSNRGKELLKQSAKGQAATLIVRSLAQKQKYFFKAVVQYSWIKKQIEVTNQSFAKKEEPKIKQINNKKQFINLINILRNYNLSKLRGAFNKIAYNAFATNQNKKSVEIIANNSPKKTMNYSKSPQKPPRNYAEEKKVLLQTKSEIQSEIQRIEYRMSDKKHSVQFERGKLIKKMDQFTKKVRKLQTEVLQKRKRNQELQKLLSGLASSGIQIQLQEGQPKIEELTQIYAELLRNNSETIKIEQFIQKYHLNTQNMAALVQEWNVLKVNIQLKKEIALWQGYEPKQQKLRLSFKSQQEMQRQLLRGYIRERYLWQWVHDVVQKV